jgi:hypothetical protein
MEMMKRAITLAAATALAIGLTTGPASADGDGWWLDEPHPHALLVGVGFEPEFSFRKCVDLAGGNALPMNNHHHNVHMPDRLHGTTTAGHLVVPYTCAQIAAALEGE